MPETPKLTRAQGLTYGAPPRLTYRGLSAPSLTYTGDDGSGPTPPGGEFRPWGFADPVNFDAAEAAFDGLFAPDYNPWNWGTAAMSFDDTTATMDGTYTP